MLKGTMGVTLMCAALAAAAAGWADPVAPLPQFSVRGERMVQAIGETRTDIENSIPSKATVGVPAYPGSYFLFSAQGDDGTERPMLPTVTLVSSDPPGKVNAWYRRHLAGWSWDRSYEAFFLGAHGLQDVRKLFTTPHVSVQPATPTADAAMYRLANIRSRIEIAYRPRVNPVRRLGYQK
jgi:hypothetical protein